MTPPDERTDRDRGREPEPPGPDAPPAGERWWRADRGRRGRDWAGGPPWAGRPTGPAGNAEQGGPPWGRRWGGPPWARAGGMRRPPYRRFGCLFVLVGLVFVLVAVSIALVALAALAAVVTALTGATGGSGAVGLVPAASLLVLAVGVVAILVVARAARSVARPLDDLVDAAERLEGGDYSARVTAPARGPRGLRDLVRGFNTMASRLEAEEAQRRSLLADVSHELRTPLTVVQGNIEAILDGVYPADAAHLEPLLEETRVLGRLVDDLRTLALAEAGTLALHREATDLRVLIGDVVAAFGAPAAVAGIELSATAGDLPLVDVDPIRIREVLANLVSNAIAHTPRGGRVTVTADAVPERVRLRVSDTGSGIEPNLLPHVFERFAKGRRSHGSGLGLAIARGIVAAHGGSIRVGSSSAAGTTFEVELPIGEARG
jgi:signal transduction histidine kinase